MEDYEKCKHVQSIGTYAVYVDPGCPKAHKIKGKLVSSRRKCEHCRGGEGNEKIPGEMENLILEMLQKGEKYKAITARTGVTEATVGRVARDNGICRRKRNVEKGNNYPPELMEEWDRVRIEILKKG